MAEFESSYYNPNCNNDEYDFEEDQDEVEDEPDMDQDESDEDTEEASETENRRSDHNGKDSKDQIYHDKLELLKKQLQFLMDGSLQDFNRRLKPLDQQLKERNMLNDLWRKHHIELMEKDFIAEKNAAEKEFEEKMIELKENLLQEMQEKKRIIEMERTSMDLSGDREEAKPTVTRKLRRRPNDPAPLPDKRRVKNSGALPNINFLLDDKEIDYDLKAISKGIKSSSGSSLRKSVPIPSNGVPPVIPSHMESLISDTRIEDGKLHYERKWYHRGQPVFVEGRDLPKFPAIISAIGSEAVMVKKTIDSSKVKISIMQLVRNKVSIRRRAAM